MKVNIYLEIHLQLLESLSDPDYRESGTFESNKIKHTEGFVKPKSVSIPKTGSFDELRELLDLV